MNALVALVVMLSATLPPQASASTPEFEAAYRTAMASYYAALLASGEGDAEATRRHVLLLRARWEAVARESREGGPDWARDTTTGQSPIAAVAALLDDIQSRTTSLDTSQAHLDLEGIRGRLRDARARHGVRGLDDALTDYHDTMERLTSRVGLRNEILLNAEDYAAIRELADRARAFWQEFETLAGPFAARSDWREAVAGTRDDLATLRAAAAVEDGRLTQEAGVALREHYLQLVRILSRG